MMLSQAQPQCDEDLVGPEKDPIIAQDPEFSFASSTPPVGLPLSASTPVHRVRTHRAPNEIARRNSPPSSPEPPVSLLDGRYLLGPQIEFSPLHRCIDIFTKEEFICRVSLPFFSSSFISNGFLSTDLEKLELSRKWKSGTKK